MEKKVRFQMKPKVGRVMTTVGGRRVTLKPGDMITCLPSELGRWQWRFNRLDPEEPEVAQQPSTGLKAVHLGFGRYNVVNEATGKPINDDPLNKAEAHAMASRGIVDPETETEKSPGDGEDKTGGGEDKTDAGGQA
jgi:hypothetical protein